VPLDSVRVISVIQPHDKRSCFSFIPSSANNISHYISYITINWYYYGTPLGLRPLVTF